MEKILKNLGLALLSTPVAGILVFLAAGMVSLINEALDFIEKPWGFKVYFLIGFIVSFIYIQYKKRG